MISSGKTEQLNDRSRSRSSSSSGSTLLLAAILVSLLINLVDHCYSDIGCFPLSDQFYHPRHRPFNVRPWHRRRIRTRFELYNRHHPDGYLLRPWDRLSLIGSRFNPLLETKVIVPGWLDNIRRALWVRRLKDALLWRWHPVNIIVVHWRNFTPYTIATANTRVVGAELANLIRSIEAELHYDRSYYHLIGHSLGAHISGYCGDRLPGLGRITALDPARPFFQHMPKSVRLDRGDARFVDAIHSDFTPENAILLLMSFGMTTPVGHLDFYPNGPPLLQPGCLRDSLLSVRNGIQRGLEHSSLAIAFLESIRYLTACDHQRSHQWFIESITNRHCVFVGVRCNEFEGMINGRCTCDDSQSACAIMGIHADQMYLNDAHEDLWPFKTHRQRRRRRQRPSSPQMNEWPSPASLHGHRRPPLSGAALRHLADPSDLYREPTEELGATMSREQIYSKLKQQAHRARQPPLPPVIPDELFENFDDIQDAAFVYFLRSNDHFAPVDATPTSTAAADEPQQQAIVRRLGQGYPTDGLDNRAPPLPPLPSEPAELTRGYKSLDRSSGDGNGGRMLQQHPRLMSDLDRDIEDWYEGSSRWFLKTNNRPQFCVNQYQVLVFIGPLKTSGSRERVRANLVISIIGSRGQLMNQRFVPRSANLDSFTMQPFFILLEGSYSLGNILAVAVGWEARLDPEPVKASVSFRSNLLESIQSFWPTYEARHPLLSETLKYDHSEAFRWRSPPPLASSAGGGDLGRRESNGPLSRRSSSLVGAPDGERPTMRGQQQLAATEGRPEGCSSLRRHIAQQEAGGRQPQQKQCSAHSKPLTAQEDDAKEDDNYLGDDDDDDESLIDELLDATNNVQSSGPPENNLASNGGELAMDDESTSWPTAQLTTSQLLGQQQQDRVSAINRAGLSLSPIGPIFQTNNNNRMEPNFHDLDIGPTDQLLFEQQQQQEEEEEQAEDSIVVSKVVISPLQATYGRHGATKLGRTFCPAHANFRLHRDRTVRLVQSFMGECKQPHHPHQHY